MMIENYIHCIILHSIKYKKQDIIQFHFILPIKSSRLIIFIQSLSFPRLLSYYSIERFSFINNNYSKRLDILLFPSRDYAQPKMRKLFILVMKKNVKRKKRKESEKRKKEKGKRKKEKLWRHLTAASRGDHFYYVSSCGWAGHESTRMDVRALFKPSLPKWGWFSRVDALFPSKKVSCTSN